LENKGAINIYWRRPEKTCLKRCGAETVTAELIRLPRKFTEQAGIDKNELLTSPLLHFN